MGAEVFFDEVSGETAKEAFNEAVRQARYNFGHAGYTGTIAEKDDFVVLPCIEGKTPIQSANEYLEKRDKRVTDKWGPAGCVKTETGFLFFGYASC